MEERMTMTEALTMKPPVWLTGLAAAGIAWNLFGVWQFAGSFTQTEQSLMAAGMAQGQAALYLALPVWVSIAFAIGVLGGLTGSIALLARRSVAVPVLAASLAGYIVLFAADWSFGVFAAIPEQLAILAMVVLIAMVLMAAAAFAARKSLLRA
jgi:hypothetical protein